MPLKNFVMKIAGKDPDGKVKGIAVNEIGAVKAQLTGSVSSRVKTARHIGPIDPGEIINLVSENKEVIIHEVTAIYTNDSIGRESFRLYLVPGYTGVMYTPLISTTAFSSYITPSIAEKGTLFKTIANDQESKVVVLRESPLRIKGFSVTLHNQSGSPQNFAFYMTYSEVE